MVFGLPLLAFVLFWLCCFWRAERPDWRQSFVVSTLIWGVATTAIVEGLSLFTALTPTAVLLAWLAAIAVTAVRVPWARIQRTTAEWMRSATGEAIVAPWVGVPLWPRRRNVQVTWPTEARLLIAALVAIIGTVGLIAVSAGISTNDVLDYHLPRVLHWIENRGVAFYPTSVPRQLNLTPWTEYAITQFRILGGGDAWTNLVQWWSFIGCAIGVSLIARELGATQRGQLLAALVTATIPMAILQGATAQNDLTEAYWTVIFAYLVLRVASSPDLAALMAARTIWNLGMALGVALGLALLTKNTGYLFTLPFVIWLMVIALRRYRVVGIPLGVIATGTALLLNLGYYLRNIGLYGSPLGPGQEAPAGQDWGKYTNDVLSLSTLASNVVRFLALNIGLPGLAPRQTGWVVSLLGALGIDASDPRTTWTGQVFSVGAFGTNEDQAGNLLHLLLIAAVIIAVLLLRRLRRSLVVIYSGLRDSRLPGLCRHAQVVAVEHPPVPDVIRSVRAGCGPRARIAAPAMDRPSGGGGAGCWVPAIPVLCPAPARHRQ